MVKSTLVRELVEGGADLLRALDRREFAIEAMFWVLLPEQDYWRLVVGLPGVTGLAAYQRVIDVLRRLDLPGPASQDISVLDPGQPYFQVLICQSRTLFQNFYRFFMGRINGRAGLPLERSFGSR
jgi:hypothetical protein